MCIWCSLVADDLETHWEVFEASLDDDDDTIAGDNISSMTRWHHETMTRLTGTMLEIQVWRCGAGGWWRDGWRTLHSFHIIPSSPLSQISHKVAGLGLGARSRAINYLSASLAAAWPPGDPLFRSGSEECLLEAWTLASLGCKGVSYCHTPTFPSVVPYTVHGVVRRN